MFEFFFFVSAIHLLHLSLIDVLKNEDQSTTQAAKGKQFTIDYDLLCYKIIFQLAFKRGDHFFLSGIQCETDLVNEREYMPSQQQ